VWDVDSYECIAILEGHSDVVRALANWSRTVVSGSDDHTVKVWDISRSECLQTLCGHNSKILSLATSGKFLFSGSHDGMIRYAS
jgi:WD40 repeat protein